MAKALIGDFKSSAKQAETEEKARVIISKALESNKKEAGVYPQTPASKDGQIYGQPASTFSIAELLEAVNIKEENFLKYFPDAFALMNNYSEDYVDTAVDYWYNDDIADRYSPAEYIKDMDAGGNRSVVRLSSQVQHFYQ